MENEGELNMDKVTKVQVLKNAHGDYVGEIRKDGSIGYLENLDLALAIREECGNKTYDLVENLSRLIDKFQLEVKEVLVVGDKGINITDMTFLEVSFIKGGIVIYTHKFNFLKQYFEGKDIIEHKGTYYNRQLIESVKPIYWEE